MDKDRQIRFLFPPLFLLVFIWAAIVSDKQKHLRDYLSFEPNLSTSAAVMLKTSFVQRSNATDLATSVTNLLYFNSQAASGSNNQAIGVASSALITNIERLAAQTAVLGSNSATMASNLAVMAHDPHDLKSAETSGPALILQVVEVVVAGGALVLVLGWAIGAVSLGILRVYFGVHSEVWCLDRLGNHESWYSKATVLAMQKHITARDETRIRRDSRKGKQESTTTTDQQESTTTTDQKELTHPESLFTAATFDHELLPVHVHEWQLRRWSSFTTSVNSCVALPISWLFVSWLGIDPSGYWYISLIFLFGVFFCHARTSWKETMGMIAFQASRLPGCFNPENSRDNESKTKT